MTHPVLRSVGAVLEAPPFFGPPFALGDSPAPPADRQKDGLTDMTSSTRVARRAPAALLGFLCLCAALIACSNNPSQVSDLDCNPLEKSCNKACKSDLDCASPNRHFICANDGFCLPVCRSSADCNVAHDAFGGAPWQGCEFGGCTCSDFTCLVPDCFTSDECGAKICRAGRCQDAAESFDRCEVYPAHAVLGVDGRRTFTVVAYAGEEAVIAAEKPTWSASGGVVRLTTTEESGMRATFTGAAATQGATQAVRATMGGVSCSAEVEVIARSNASLRAVLVDETSGRTIQGATVVADTSGGQIALEEEAGTPGSYILNGEATAGALTLSAFHPDFNSVTIAGLSARDLMVPMRRVATLNKGGVRGAVTTLASASTSNLSAGFVGLSVQGSLLDLGLEQFLGETVTTDISIAGLVDLPGVALPSGVVIGDKDSFLALGGAGPCGEADKARSGLCGNQSAFSLGFSMPVTDLAPLAGALTGGGPIDYGALLSQALPILSQVELGMVRDVPFDLVPAADFAVDAVAVRDMTPSLALNRSIALSLPALPTLDGEAVGFVAGAALALVEDRGFVPLGLGAGVADAQGKIGEVALQMAAPQGGIEGSDFVLVAIALPGGGVMADGALGLSGVVARMPSPEGERLPEIGGDFIGLPSGGAFEGVSRSVRGVAEVEGAGVYRLIFTLASGRRWTVTFGGGEVALPRPPEGFEDLDASAATVPFMAQAVRLAGDAGVDALFKIDGEEGVARLNALTRAFSIHEAAVDSAETQVESAP